MLCARRFFALKHTHSCFFPEFFNRVRVVFHIDIKPHEPRNAENVDKIDGQKSDEQPEGGRLTPAKKPVKKGNENQAKPPCPDVRNKHGAVVITGLRKKIEVTFGAAMEHLDGLDERPTTRFERFALVATRAFEIKNTVSFGAFSEKRHSIDVKKSCFLKRFPKVDHTRE
jgi:hypothetical protein